MEYMPVQWSIGDTLDSTKIKQMADNDATIRTELLNHPLGIIAQEFYGGANKTAASGVWTNIITLTDVVIPPGRWIKVSACFHTLSNTLNIYCPMRVTQDGTEILYSRVPEQPQTSVLGVSNFGTRILRPQGGTYTFVLQVGQDSGAAGIVSAHTMLLELQPAELVIEDIGGLQL